MNEKKITAAILLTVPALLLLKALALLALVAWGLIPFANTVWGIDLPLWATFFTAWFTQGLLRWTPHPNIPRPAR